MESMPATTHAGAPDRTSAPDRLGLGTTALRSDRLDVAFGVLDAWRAAGGRLIDTAAVYGAGESERAIGAWLRDRGARDDVELLTKGAHPDQRDWSSRMTPTAIEADLVASLDRLGVQAVDAYLVHRDDPGVPVGVILEALAAQVTAGRARSYGVSNWTVPRLDAALEYVDRHGLPPLAWSSSYLGLARPAGPIWPGSVDACDETSRAWYASHATRSWPGPQVATGSSSRMPTWRTGASILSARPGTSRAASARPSSPSDAA